MTDLADAAPRLSAAQLAFLRLHVLRQPDQWRWHWFETMLRVRAGRRTATLWADEVVELVGMGLMERGAGFEMRATASGVACVMQSRVEKESV